MSKMSQLIGKRVLYISVKNVIINIIKTKYLQNIKGKLLLKMILF